MGQGGSASANHAPPPPRGTRTPAFRRLWAAWAVSLLGDGVRAIALPLYVAIETRSALAASAVTAAEVLPWLLFALPAGAIVDRSSAKRIVILAHTGRALLTAALVAMIFTDTATVPVLCAFAFVLTIGETFAYPASQSLLVELAGRDELEAANAKFYAVHTIGVNLAGPLAAGALFTVGPELAFGLDGLTFVVAAALVIGLPAGSRPEQREQRPAIAAQIVEGVAILWRVIGLRVLVLVIGVATISAGAINALTALFALETLQMREEFVPLLLVASALGTLAATRMVGPVSRRFSDGPVMVASMAIIAGGMVGFGLSGNAVSGIVAYTVIGLGLGGFNVLAAARRQRLTPQGAMGRVSGAYRMLAWGLTPVGAGLAGPLAVVTSLGSVFIIGGALILTVLAATAVLLIRTGTEVPAPRTPAEQPPNGRGGQRRARHRDRAAKR